MCGIAGIVDLRGLAVSQSELELLASGLKHRGPDGAGIHIAGQVGLVNRRLAIIDPAGGQQPVYNDARTISIVYNGEIYNFIELRRELESRFRFHSGCDTEVILRAYERWGPDCVSRLRGMFAFAIHDQVRKVVFLARDRVGIKPLYVAKQGGRVAFASELQPLVSLDWIERRVDMAAVAQYLRFGYIPDPQTIYSSVSKLEAAHALEIDLQSRSLKSRCYWNLAPRDIHRSESEWMEAINFELDQSVRLHTRGDVPFGAFLSGGIDSSIVTASMRPYVTGRVQTFSIGFEESKYSELPYAREASKCLGTEHTERIVRGQSVDEPLLRTIVKHFGEPFGDSSAVPTWHVSQLAAQSVKMVLSGDGGDEGFAGYGSYVDVLRPRQPERRAFGIARAVRGLLGPKQMQSPWSRHDVYRTVFIDSLISRLMPGLRLPERVRRQLAFNSDEDPVLKFQLEDFQLYLPGDVLTKVDRMSMANSLEVRVPLLDHRLLECAVSVPLSLKIRQDGDKLLTKYILRRSGERFLPMSFFDRPKQGFGIPLSEWCTGPLRSLIVETLGLRSNPVFDLIDFDAARPIWQNDVSGRGAGSLTWTMLMLALWAEEVNVRH